MATGGGVTLYGVNTIVVLFLLFLRIICLSAFLTNETELLKAYKYRESLSFEQNF